MYCTPERSITGTICIYRSKHVYMYQARSQGGSLGVEEPHSQIKGSQFYQKGPLFCLKNHKFVKESTILL